VSSTKPPGEGLYLRAGDSLKVICSVACRVALMNQDEYEGRKAVTRDPAESPEMLEHLFEASRKDQYFVVLDREGVMVVFEHCRGQRVVERGMLGSGLG
jgi:hypothetical protein